MAPKTEKKKQ